MFQGRPLHFVSIIHQTIQGATKIQPMRNVFILKISNIVFLHFHMHFFSSPKPIKIPCVFSSFTRVHIYAFSFQSLGRSNSNFFVIVHQLHICYQNLQHAFCFSSPRSIKFIVFFRRSQMHIYIRVFVSEPGPIKTQISCHRSAASYMRRYRRNFGSSKKNKQT